MLKNIFILLIIYSGILNMSANTTALAHDPILQVDERGYYWNILNERLPAYGLNNVTHIAIKSGNFLNAEIWEKQSPDQPDIPDHTSCVSIPQPFVVTLDDFRLTIKDISIGGMLRLFGSELTVCTIVVEPTGSFALHDDFRLNFKLTEAQVDPNDDYKFQCGLIVFGNIDAVGFLSFEAITRFTDIELDQFKQNTDESESYRNRIGPWLAPDTSRRSVRDKDFGLCFDYLLNYPIDYQVPIHFLNYVTGEFTTAADSLVPGHILIHSSHSHTVSFQNCRFTFLGRTRNDLRTDFLTNKAGRYPLHFHHSAAEVAVVNNCAVINNSLHHSKWGIVLHHQRNTKITNCFVYGQAGAGITVEGEDDYNYSISNNAIMGIGPGRDGGNNKIEKIQGVGDPGITGDGIWFRSNPDPRQNCVVDGNFISSCDGYGISINGYAPEWNAKIFPPRPAKITNTTIRGQITGGMWIVWDQGPGAIKKFIPQSYCYNLRVINPEQFGINQYHSSNWTFEGCTFFIDSVYRIQHPAVNLDRDLKYATLGFGYESPSYENGGHNLFHNVVVGFDVAVAIPRNCLAAGDEHILLKIDDIHVRNCYTIFWGATARRENPYGVDVYAVSGLSNKVTFILKYYPLTTYPFGRHDLWDAAPIIFVDGKRYFLKEQHPDFIIPAEESIPPEFHHLTNKEAFEKYGTCLGGALGTEDWRDYAENLTLAN